MPMPTPAQAATNWANGMSGASAKMTAGINAVTSSPMDAAANASDRYLMGIQKAVSSGKWQAGLRKVSTQDWKDAMINKGVPRVASGAQAAKPKMQNFMTNFLPFLANGVNQMNSSNPRGDLEANIARSAFMQRWNANYSKNG